MAPFQCSGRVGFILPIGRGDIQMGDAVVSNPPFSGVKENIQRKRNGMMMEIAAVVLM